MALTLKMPVLVVDDHQVMIRIIRDLVKRIGFQDVDVASDGVKALEQLRSKSYGLVISDWNMDRMTGYQLLCRVRADRALHSIPFILVTAESKLDNVVAAKTAGVSNYIIKPFSAQALKQKIEAIFADRPSRDEGEEENVCLTLENANCGNNPPAEQPSPEPDVYWLP